jgi:hypothetical protein
VYQLSTDIHYRSFGSHVIKLAFVFPLFQWHIRFLKCNMIDVVPSCLVISVDKYTNFRLTQPFTFIAKQLHVSTHCRNIIRLQIKTFKKRYLVQVSLLLWDLKIVKIIENISLFCQLVDVIYVNTRLRWSRGSVLAFGTQVRGFKPGRSRRIFRAKKSSAHLPSEGK